MELTLIGLDAIVALAIAEDLGTGDVTGEAIIPADIRCTAAVVAKQDGVVAGIGLLEHVYRTIDPEVEVTPLVADGTAVDAPLLQLARVEGPARAVLAGERIALNLLGRLSGVATATRGMWTPSQARASASSTPARPCRACGRSRSTRWPAAVA